MSLGIVARAHPLLCTLNLLFGAVLVAIAVVLLRTVPEVRTELYCQILVFVDIIVLFKCSDLFSMSSFPYEASSDNVYRERPFPHRKRISLSP